jgi:hypothetical protein
MPKLPLHDRAGFWLSFAAVPLVIGGIAAGAGVAQAVADPKSDVWSNWFFRSGAAAVVLGILLAWWALTLYVARHHAEDRWCADPEVHKKQPTTCPDPSLHAAGAAGAPPVVAILRDLKSRAEILKASLPQFKSQDADQAMVASIETWETSVHAALKFDPALQAQFRNAPHDNVAMSWFSAHPLVMRMQNKISVLDGIIKLLTTPPSSSAS